MFVRVKASPNTSRKTVLLVAAKRVDGKTRQEVIRRIGTAKDDEELEQLKRIGELYKAQIREENEPSLFPPEEMALMAIEAKQRKRQEKVAARSREERGREREQLAASFAAHEKGQRAATGVPEVYRHIYRELGLHGVLPKKRSRISHEVLFYMVLARIVYPASKSGSVRSLEEDFGVSIQLHKVYRMMDQLDPKRIGHMCQLVEDASRALLPRTPGTVYFDCTTVAFDASEEEVLRQKTYRSERKHEESLAILALATSEEGLPLGYDVLTGSACEEDSLVSSLQGIKMRLGIERAVCLADYGTFSDANLSAIEELGDGYVVGIRLRDLPSALKQRILDRAAYRPMKGPNGRWVAEFEHRGRRLIVMWRPEQARSSGQDRRMALAGMKWMQDREGIFKGLEPNPAAVRVLAADEEARPEIASSQFAKAKRWEGLVGVLTNLRDIPAEEILARDRGLWEVEECLRITKHDLQAGRVFHWTEGRVHAHMAITYMAYACIRHLAFRAALQQRTPPKTNLPETIL